MPRVRLKVKPPGGLFEFTEEHSDAEFAILSAFPAEDELLVILKAEMNSPSELIEFFESSSFIHDFEVRHSDPATVVVGYTLPFVPPPVRAIFDAGELPRFPVRIKNGFVYGDMTTSHRRISMFKDGLEMAGVPYEVLSVTQEGTTDAILTDRQREFVAAALAHGYYDTPRGCTLTDLAMEMAVSKATASQVLHRAEEQIVKDFDHRNPL